MKKASKSAVSNLITYGIVIAAYIICQVLIENCLLYTSDAADE